MGCEVQKGLVSTRNTEVSVFLFQCCRYSEIRRAYDYHCHPRDEVRLALNIILGSAGNILYNSWHVQHLFLHSFPPLPPFCVSCTPLPLASLPLRFLHFLPFSVLLIFVGDDLTSVGISISVAFDQHQTLLTVVGWMLWLLSGHDHGASGHAVRPWHYWPCVLLVLVNVEGSLSWRSVTLHIVVDLADICLIFSVHCIWFWRIVGILSISVWSTLTLLCYFRPHLWWLWSCNVMIPDSVVALWLMTVKPFYGETMPLLAIFSRHLRNGIMLFWLVELFRGDYVQIFQILR